MFGVLPLSLPQEHEATASTASGNHYTVLLSAAIVEKFQLFHDSSLTRVRCNGYQML